MWICLFIGISTETMQKSYKNKQRIYSLGTILYFMFILTKETANNSEFLIKHKIKLLKWEGNLYY